MPDVSDNLLHFLHQGLSTLSVPAHTEYFSQLESWLDDICDTMGLDPKIRTQLQIAADEIFTNICFHAYPEQSSDGSISLTCSLDLAKRTLALVFSDQGVWFDPLQQPLPDVNTRRKGGSGLLLVRKFADALMYERQGNNNILTFLKKI